MWANTSKKGKRIQQKKGKEYTKKGKRIHKKRKTNTQTHLPRQQPAGSCWEGPWSEGFSRAALASCMPAGAHRRPLSSRRSSTEHAVAPVTVPGQVSEDGSAVRSCCTAVGSVMVNVPVNVSVPVLPVTSCWCGVFGGPMVNAWSTHAVP